MRSIYEDFDNSFDDNVEDYSEVFDKQDMEEKIKKVVYEFFEEQTNISTEGYNIISISDEYCIIDIVEKGGDLYINETVPNIIKIRNIFTDNLNYDFTEPNPLFPFRDAVFKGDEFYINGDLTFDDVKYMPDGEYIYLAGDNDGHYSDLMGGASSCDDYQYIEENGIQFLNELLKSKGGTRPLVKRSLTYDNSDWQPSLSTRKDIADQLEEQNKILQKVLKQKEIGYEGFDWDFDPDDPNSKHIEDYDNEDIL